ncbi:beta strand repeat-containing protein [Laspinema olomoucense]|uniref:S-layer family protein n=1 Tax=Laspinema olomoucense D3b TaxID=2953688 RepID=A0ABT2NFL2_9CYAN|nr:MULTISPECIES: S-layer family protein [unclassified Laspinema]MCT7981484.1 S-layer family protein [Laspinema sp. D3b]MCT7997506.1 S-layer family protein [Laspinema sp. D3c]
MSRYLLKLFVGIFWGCASPVQAQIIPDATLPVNTTVIREGGASIIKGGTQAEGNLFHSFQEFSLPTNTPVSFDNALDIKNIFSRVTGSSISNIDGLIQVNGGANLFFLNPNGIVFGPNAQLNMGGSFLASTGDRLNFADGTSFSTLPTEPVPLLTVSLPVGLQMGPNPGKIIVQGPGNNLSLTEPVRGSILRENRPTGLQVQNKTLALIGGEIELNGGNLSTVGGQIELGSVGANSQVMLTVTSPFWGFAYSEGGIFGDIKLTAASLDTSGEGGGPISLQGRSLFLREGSALISLTLGSQPGQDIQLFASEQVEFSGANSLGLPSVAIAEVFPGARGDGGSLKIESAQFYTFDGALISASTRGQGNGGNLTIQATESIKFSGLDISGGFGGLFAEVRSNTTGNAGIVTIETGQLTLLDGAIISATTFGEGYAGILNIRARESVSMSGVDGDGFGAYIQTGSGSLDVETEPSVSSGMAVHNSVDTQAEVILNREILVNSGAIAINTTQLTVSDGAVISSSTDARGNAGTLTVRASESVTLRGSDSLGNGSKLETFVNSEVTGNAGSLTVETGKLLLLNGASISSETIGNGNAGDVTITAEQVSLFDGSQIRVSAKGAFSPGVLTVRAGEILLDNQASFLGETESGSQGNITILANSTLLRRNSQITTNATGSATGGNIMFDTAILGAFENSDISANSEQSQGGIVTIQAEGIFGTEFRVLASDFTSDITATGADSSLSGTVRINTPEVDPTSGLVELAVNLADQAQELDSSCRSGQQQSEFIITGRGGLPPNPMEAISDEALLMDLGPQRLERLPRKDSQIPSVSAASILIETPSPEQLVEAEGWIINSQGEMELVARNSRGTGQNSMGLAKLPCVSNSPSQM